MSEGGSRIGRVIGCFALAIVGLACVAGMGVTLGRHAIVTSVARGELRERGVECDERFALEVSLMLDEAVLAPTTCTLASGDVESVEVVDPVTVGIAGGRPTRVEGGSARVALRSTGSFRATGWGAILDALSIPERIGTMVAGFGQLARAGAPPISMRSIEIQRGGQPMLTLTTLAADGASPLGVTVERAELPLIEGPIGARARVQLTGVRSSATPQSVTMDAQLDVDASMPMIGSLDQQRPVHVVVEGLDTDVPRWTVQ